MSSHGRLPAGEPAASPAHPAAASRRFPVQTPFLPILLPCSQTASAARASLVPGAIGNREGEKRLGREEKSESCLLLHAQHRVLWCRKENGSRARRCMEVAVPPMSGQVTALSLLLVSSSWPVLGLSASAH